MVRIIFLEPPAFMPSEYADFDDSFSLDLNNNERIALSRIIDDYADIGSIKQDTFKEIEIPITKKNRLLLGNIGNPSALNLNSSKVFRIQLLKGDFSYPVSGLQIVSVNDLSYSVILFGEVNDWVRLLAKTKLSELELGQALIDQTYVSTQGGTEIYQDDDDPVYFPLVNYGRWFVYLQVNGAESAPAQVVFNNLRMWFSALAIMRQMFCQIGYELIIPILETNKYRRLRTYNLDPEFETANQLDVANRPFEFELTGDFPLTLLYEVRSNEAGYWGVIPFSIISDVGNHSFRNLTSGPLSTNYGTFYSGGFVGTLRATGTVNFMPDNASLHQLIAPNYLTIDISIRRAPKFGFNINDNVRLRNNSTIVARQVFTRQGTYGTGTNINFDFDIQSSEHKFYAHEVLFVLIDYSANSVELGSGVEFGREDFGLWLDLKSGATFANEVSLQVIEKGDTIEFGKLLHKEQSCLDYMKGIAHLLGLKIETNTISKKVSMYPEFKMDLGAEGVQEAFFFDNYDNPLYLDDKIQVKSMIQNFRNTDLYRDVYLKFLDSSDGYIQSLNPTTEYHSKSLDLGPDFKDGTNVLENPFFEPMIAGVDNDISNLQIVLGPYTGETSSNYIPFMWESQPTGDNYPDVGFDFAPRVMLSYFFETLVADTTVTGKDNETESLYVYEDLRALDIATGAQIYPLGVRGRNLAVYTELTETIVYGSDSVEPSREDLYELLYSRIINQAYFNIALEFLVLIDLIEFSNISFRRKVHIKYKSQAWGEIDFFARLSKVTDYVIGENLTTPVEVIPDNNNFLYC